MDLFDERKVLEALEPGDKIFIKEHYKRAHDEMGYTNVEGYKVSDHDRIIIAGIEFTWYMTVIVNGIKYEYPYHNVTCEAIRVMPILLNE